MRKNSLEKLLEEITGAREVIVSSPGEYQEEEFDMEAFVDKRVQRVVRRSIRESLPKQAVEKAIAQAKEELSSQISSLRKAHADLRSSLERESASGSERASEISGILKSLAAMVESSESNSMGRIDGLSVAHASVAEEIRILKAVDHGKRQKMIDTKFIDFERQLKKLDKGLYEFGSQLSININGSIVAQANAINISKYEIPKGSGSNFTFKNVPLPSALDLFRGGAEQFPGVDYTISGNSVVLSTPLQVGEALWGNYLF